MKHKPTNWRSIVIVVTVVFACVTRSSTSWAEEDAKSGIVPPDTHYHGLTYRKLSAKWWKWMYTQPTAVNPLTDLSGEHCAQGQAGHVWFLAGAVFSLSAPEPEQIITRNCTIPAGKVLFVPVLNAAWTTYRPNPPFEGDKKACLKFYPSLQECARDQLKQQLNLTIGTAQLSAKGVQVTIDGVAVKLKLTENATSPYRVQSPTFRVLVPIDNIADLSTETCSVKEGKLDCYPYYADGLYLMFKPLKAGSHTLHIVAGDYFDVTYQLTIQHGEAEEDDSVDAAWTTEDMQDEAELQLFLPLVQR